MNKPDKQVKKAMMWTNTHFPSAMRSLSPSTRAKAIEIANDLLNRDDMDKQQVISVSIDEARRLARMLHSDSDRRGNYATPTA